VPWQPCTCEAIGVEYLRAYAVMTEFDEAGFSSATYKVLYQIAERATSEKTLFDFGKVLHRLLVELVPAKNLYLCLLSEQPGRLNFPYYVDERDGDSMQEMDVPMRLGLTEFVLRSGAAELIDQTRYNALQACGEITEATGDLSFTSWLGVPLHIKGRVGGVLAVQSYDASVAYQAADAHLLSFVARHVSTAIERKQSFDALHRSEERYRTVIEQVGQGMMVLEDDRVLFANPQAATMFGLTLQDLPQQGWTQYLDPQDRLKAVDALRGLAQGLNGNLRLELQVNTPDGAPRWLEMGATRVRWEDALATLAFLSDVTQRKQLELALRRTSFEREAMLNTALVGISFNVQDKIVWVNEKCAEMSGFKRDDLIGKSPRIFYESDEAFWSEKQKSEAGLRRTGTYNSERHTLRKNGDVIWVLLAGRCVEGLDPDAGVIWTLLDVTARRRAEDDIREALERQRELNVLRSRFVAMTSHEFRTPLASILSSAELLRYYSERVSPKERGELLQSIEAGVQRMTQMLDRILLIGKAEADMLEFKPQPLDLRALCEQLVKDAGLQHPLAKSSIVLDWQLQNTTGNFDEKLCRHIFSNLLSNALKYSPQGGTVRWCVQPEQERTLFAVRDEGIGIPADELHHLFDSFHRASNVGAIAGTGLGLSIVKKSVELHGGSITVSSALGEGTCFTVVL
jgi:PAS domain S-box-containing protein